MSPALLAGAAADAEHAGDLALAGVDAIVAYHSSEFRRRGMPSVAGLLPWVNANDQTAALLTGVLGGAGEIPVVATVCANDMTKDVDEILVSHRARGAAGVLNAPTTGLFTGPVRQALEESGLGMKAELELIARAHAHDLEAWSYVFDRGSTDRALDAGADVVVVHLGITGSARPDPKVLAAARECLDAASGHEQVCLHGGPLREPGDLAELLRRLEQPPGGIGFLGASALERDDRTGTRAVVQAWRDVLDQPTTRNDQVTS